MKTELVNNCGACRWWAPSVRNRIFGFCGQETRAGVAVDKYETCEKFEKKPEKEDYLE